MMFRLEQYGREQSNMESKGVQPKKTGVKFGFWTIVFILLAVVVGAFFGYKGASAATMILFLVLLASLLILIEYVKLGRKKKRT